MIPEVGKSYHLQYLGRALSVGRCIVKTENGTWIFKCLAGEDKGSSIEVHESQIRAEFIAPVKTPWWKRSLFS